MNRGWLDKRVQAWRRLNELRRMWRTPGLLEAAYDWLAMEIAQLERELYGRELGWDEAYMRMRAAG